MKNCNVAVIAIVSTLTYLNSPVVQAGPYSDDMAKCLVRSTTSADRSSFVRWIFAAASSHPAVRSIATVSAEQHDEFNKSTAMLFQRLLTESCRLEVQQAVKYEGPQTVAASFQVLGEVAGRELFADPEVTKSMADFEKYFDNQKLDELFNVKQQ